jgi:hypothetical protein
MNDRRRKNVSWHVCQNGVESLSFDAAQLAVLMDIRDELQTLNQLAGCFRIPRALDAMIELGAAARRKKRAAAKKRKAAS